MGQPVLFSSILVIYNTIHYYEEDMGMGWRKIIKRWLVDFPLLVQQQNKEILWEITN
jgi:hypothetical protein